MLVSRGTDAWRRNLNPSLRCGVHASSKLRDQHAAMLDPMRVRVTRCHSCGGRKQLPSQTAYVYCDFCGALADWDFRAACSAGNALPGPAFEALRARIAPVLAQAKARGDTTTTKGLYV